MNRRWKCITGSAAIAVVVLLILVVLPTLPQKPSIPPAPPGYSFRDQAMSLLKASNMLQFHDSLASMESMAIAQPQLLAAALKEYSGYYTGTPDLPAQERQNDVARVLMIVAGRSGNADAVGQYLTEQSPRWVPIALADAKGVRFYYAVTEGGQLDMKVPYEVAIRIMTESPLFRPWGDRLKAWGSEDKKWWAGGMRKRQDTGQE